MSIIKVLFIILFFSYGNMTFGLDRDELLTVRILKLSSSKKTALINRGQEDGIVVDDQAKFFLTKGIVARGIVVKVTPTRSVWSFYRIVTIDDLMVDTVLKIKKTAAYRVTVDKTKELTLAEQNSPIPLAPGANDQNELHGMDDLKEVQNQKTKVVYKTTPIKRFSYKTMEFWGTLSFNSLSSTYDLGNGQGGTGANFSSDYSLGMEKYFKSKSMIQNFSIYGFIHKTDRSALTSSGQLITLSNFEYGAGATLHIGNSPFSLNKMIFFVNVAMAIGSSSDILNLSNSGTINNTDYEIAGNSSSFSLGGGIKYLFNGGFSFRLTGDLYSLNEAFIPPNSSATEYLKTTSGVRLQLGLGVRF